MQGGFQYLVLHAGVAGSSQWIAVKEGDHESPGRAHAACDFPEELNDHGGDPLAFQFRGDQAHGLIAERSDGDQ